MRQIIAIGGIGQPAGEGGAAIYRYVLGQSGKRRPRVCLVPTASAESRERIVQFFEQFSLFECEPSWLSLFNLPTADLEGYIMNKDVIIVGGGNTRSMLALWRDWELDRIFRKTYDAGIVHAGSSAGANCWFEQCTTDSIPGPLTVLSCLGFLPGSFTPHVDVEPERRPALHRLLLAGQIGAGYAVENEVSLQFVDERLRAVVCGRESAAAYRVSVRNQSVVEERLSEVTEGNA